MYEFPLLTTIQDPFSLTLYTSLLKNSSCDLNFNIFCICFPTFYKLPVVKIPFGLKKIA